MKASLRKWTGFLLILVGASGAAVAGDRPRSSTISAHWTYYNNMGWNAYYRGDLDVAMDRFSKAIETVRPHQAEYPRLLSRSCHDLTRMLCIKERYSDAEEMAKWVVQVREIDPRTRDDVMFDSLYLLSLIHRAQGNHEDAVPLLRKAVAIEEKNIGLKDPRLAITIKELADVEARAGELTAANANYRRAIGIHKRFAGTNMDLVEALGGRAEVLEKLGRQVEADLAKAEAEQVRNEAARNPRIATHLESPLAVNPVVRPAAH